MKERILKDIRYYESNVPNVAGNSLPHSLGNIFEPTDDTVYIGQRIARKLNELKYSFGAYDHIYINLTTILEENQIQISNRNIDKTIKYIDFGVNQSKFNSLTDEQKDEFINSKTIKILSNISDSNNLSLVNDVAKQLSLIGTEIKIHYKTKETNSWKIDIYYQIKPKGSSTKMIIEYMDKKNSFCGRQTLELEFYDDIYSLIDTITLKNNEIILKPKKSFRAEIYNKRYKTPIELKIEDFKENNCH